MAGTKSEADCMKAAFGKRLKSARTKEGYKQERFAEQLKYLDPDYLPLMQETVQKQMEVISFCEKKAKRTDGFNG